METNFFEENKKLNRELDIFESRGQLPFPTLINAMIVARGNYTLPPRPDLLKWYSFVDFIHDNKIITEDNLIDVLKNNAEFIELFISLLTENEEVKNAIRELIQTDENIRNEIMDLINYALENNVNIQQTIADLINNNPYIKEAIEQKIDDSEVIEDLKDKTEEIEEKQDDSSIPTQKTEEQSGVPINISNGAFIEVNLTQDNTTLYFKANDMVENLANKFILVINFDNHTLLTNNEFVLQVNDKNIKIEMDIDYIQDSRISNVFTIMYYKIGETIKAYAIKEGLFDLRDTIYLIKNGEWQYDYHIISQSGTIQIRKNGNNILISAINGYVNISIPNSLIGSNGKIYIENYNKDNDFAFSQEFYFTPSGYCQANAIGKSIRQDIVSGVPRIVSKSIKYNNNNITNFQQISISTSTNLTSFYEPRIVSALNIYNMYFVKG